MTEPSLDHVDLLFPNRYLKAADLRGKEWSLTIASVEIEALHRVGGGKEKCPVVHFEEMKGRPKDEAKVLVLNKTNGRAVASMHGNKPREWAGKKITLHPTRVKFGRDMVDAIRVKVEGSSR